MRYLNRTELPQRSIQQTSMAGYYYYYYYYYFSLELSSSDACWETLTGITVDVSGEPSGAPDFQQVTTDEPASAYSDDESETDATSGDDTSSGDSARNGQASDQPDTESDATEPGAPAGGSGDSGDSDDSDGLFAGDTVPIALAGGAGLLFLVGAVLAIMLLRRSRVARPPGF